MSKAETSDIIRFFLRKPQVLLLMDGMGALVTASALLTVALNSPQLFGLPENKLLGLSLGAWVIAALSLAFSSILSPHWRFWLGKVYQYNLMYCLVTAGLICCFFNQVTALGFAYFLGELLIIASLVLVEIKTLRAWKQRTRHEASR